MTESAIPPGVRVRVVSNPAKIGVSTARTRKFGPMVQQCFEFAEGPQWLLVSDIEVVPEGPVDAFELLRNGQFAPPTTLQEAFVFHRLNGRLADIIYSMDASNTDYYPYQYKPLLNFLDSPSQGLLIADEVGLGKTIEAGIIWTELRARFDHSRLLVVCPAMLREKWQLELRKRFGIQSEMCNAKELQRNLEAHLRGEIEEFAYVCSTQGIRPPRRASDPDVAGRSQAKLAEFFKESTGERYLFDLVVIDEAHYMRNEESLARRLGGTLRDVSENLLLLSATPVQMRSEDLFSLLNLLDPDTFTEVDSFGQVLQANAPIVQLREKVLSRSYTLAEFRDDLDSILDMEIVGGSRQLESLVENVPTPDEFEDKAVRSRIADQFERVNLLSHVVSRTRKRDVKEFRVVRKARAQHIRMSDLEARIYDHVTEEIRRYCEQADLPEGFALSMPQRQICSSVPAAILNWRERGEFALQDADDWGYEEESESPPQFGPLVTKMISIARGIDDVALLEAQDTKFEELVRVLGKIFEDNPQQKIIVFSYFKPTLRYLARRLGVIGHSCVLLHGGMKESKDEVITRFRETEDLRILLSSEVAAEGVDLQFCRIMINYDLPWNPMQIEQRIGRIDRIGQKADTVLIWNLFYADTVDARIYDRLLLRLDVFRHALGSVEAIVGEEIRRLTSDLISDRMTPQEEEERIAQSEQAIENIRAQNERLESEAAAMIAHSERILGEVGAARDMQRYIRSGDLWTFVEGALRRYFPETRVVLLNEDLLECEIVLDNEAAYAFSRFMQDRKHRSRTGLLDPRLKPKRYRFVTRSRDLGRGTEAITNFHPLVRFLIAKVKQDGIPDYPPIAIQIDGETDPMLRPGTYPFLVTKLEFTGVRSYEWLKFSYSETDGSNLVIGDAAERFINLAATEGTDWLVPEGGLRTERVEETLAHCLQALKTDCDYHVRRLINENEDRVALQLRNVRNKFEREIEREDNIREKLERQGKFQGAKLRVGKIAKLRERMNGRLYELERARDVRHDATRTVAMGVIKVE